MRNIPDAVIHVRFKTPTEGGRQTPITGSVYSCPLFVDGEVFDCRICIEGKTIELGQAYDLEIWFLSRDLAVPYLIPGRSITLWEGKEIAIGKIKRVS